MKFFHLVWAGIWRRKGRAILTLLSVMNAFLLFGLLQGFASGLNQAVADTRADMLFAFSRVSQIEPLPMGHRAQIAAVPGVRNVSPMLIFSSTYQKPTQRVNAMAVDLQEFFASSTSLKIPPAQLQAAARTRNGAVVQDTLAQKYGWKIGDRIPLKSLLWTNRDGSTTWPVDVVGIYTSTDKFSMAPMLVNYDFVDEGRTTSNGTTSFFVVRLNDPQRANEIGVQIDKLFANSPYETKSSTVRQMAQDQIKRIGDIGLVINAIVGAVFFALLFSVGSVMMQAVRERTPELAVLKTVGFTDGGVLWLILAESLLFCLVSAGLGLGLASALFPMVKSSVGFAIAPGPVIALGLVVAALLAVATGLPPALRGMRLQIVDALAGR
ncbi:MAG: ABC transporter permease [Caulobacteraceae bacterium]